MTDKEYQKALNLMEKGIRADERARIIEILKEEIPYDICDGNEAIEEIEKILNSRK